MQKPDKYVDVKAEISAIYHENRGRYGYRRITIALHNRGIFLNHKTVQRLMKQMGLVCRVKAKKYRSYNGEVGNRCHRVQFVWGEVVSISNLGFAQWLFSELYSL